MKVAVMTGFFAKRDMEINAGQVIESEIYG